MEPGFALAEERPLRGLLSVHVELGYFAVRVGRVLGVPVFRRCRTNGDGWRALLLAVSEAVGRERVFGEWAVDFVGVATGTPLRPAVEVLRVERVREARPWCGVVV